MDNGLIYGLKKKIGWGKSPMPSLKIWIRHTHAKLMEMAGRSLERLCKERPGFSRTNQRLTCSSEWVQFLLPLCCHQPERSECEARNTAYDLRDWLPLIRESKQRSNDSKTQVEKNGTL